MIKHAYAVSLVTQGRWRGQVLCLLEIRERDTGTFTTDAVRSA